MSFWSLKIPGFLGKIFPVPGRFLDFPWKMTPLSCCPSWFTCSLVLLNPHSGESCTGMVTFYVNIVITLHGWIFLPERKLPPIISDCKIHVLVPYIPEFCVFKIWDASFISIAMTSVKGDPAASVCLPKAIKRGLLFGMQTVTCWGVTHQSKYRFISNLISLNRPLLAHLLVSRQEQTWVTFQRQS